MKTAFIFPAFVSEYIGTESDILHALSDNFQQKLIAASHATGDDYVHFSLDDSGFTGDELRSQIISYIFGCTLSDELKDRGLLPEAVAGYSMGLYAALYASGVHGFEEGIRLIEQAFEAARCVIGDTKCGMGSVIGLTRGEIGKLINDTGAAAEIANTNSRFSHLITGKADDVHLLLNMARETGALNVSLLPVSMPYHSHMLEKTRDEFERYIREKVNLNEPQYTVISSVDQQTVSTREEVIRELTRNLHESLNWEKTFEKLLETGISRFVECGAGKSLQKISRFVQGEFKVYPMNKLDKLINPKK